jgi:uncharacterized OsmC-like protein
MLTTMGILAERENIDMRGMKTEVVKIMGANPRKIAEIQIIMSQDNLVATEEQRKKLRHAALTCPVALSLHDSVKQTITLNF